MGKAISNKGEASRQKILIEAFRLFATMPYERVSFSVLEKEIGISRGSMVYYFKNKEGLFQEVLKTLVYGTSSIKAVPEAYKLSLCSFYNYFIEVLKREQEKIKQSGVVNLNEALMRIESSALSYVENFKELTAQWLDEEQQIWKDVINNAISTGEINANVDSSVLSHMFEDCYLGNAFTMLQVVPFFLKKWHPSNSFSEIIFIIINICHLENSQKGRLLAQKEKRGNY